MAKKRLTESEKDRIKKMVFQGLSDAEIAAEIGHREFVVAKYVDEMQYRKQHEAERQEAERKAAGRSQNRRTASGVTFV